MDDIFSYFFSKIALVAIKILGNIPSWCVGFLQGSPIARGTPFLMSTGAHGPFLPYLSFGILEAGSSGMGGYKSQGLLRLPEISSWNSKG